MLTLPWLMVTYVNGVNGMMACFILFFTVDPIYVILAGAYAGRQIRSMWALPVITAALFLLGAWLRVDMGEKVFFLRIGLSGPGKHRDAGVCARKENTLNRIFIRKAKTDGA